MDTNILTSNLPTFYFENIQFLIIYLQSIIHHNINNIVIYFLNKGTCDFLVD